jgi:hypothetical protein
MDGSTRARTIAEQERPYPDLNVRGIDAYKRRA